MISLNIAADINRLSASFDLFVKEQELAVVRALNKTAQQARTEAAKSVRGEGYNIKASAIKASFSIRRASRGNLTVTLVATGAPIALINYDARQTRKGVSVNVKGGRKTLAHAFIATMGNGHRGVFERKGLALQKGGRMVVNGKSVRANLPIKELFGPSIPTALANGVVLKALESKIRSKFPQVLKHEMAFIASKRQAR